MGEENMKKIVVIFSIGWLLICLAGTVWGSTESTSIGENDLFGFEAGKDNTSGGYNSFFGNMAGWTNTTGSFNSFFGEGAGLNNRGGNNNSFFGREAGFLNTAGTDNSFFGVHAGASYSTGTENSFFGVDAGTGNLSTGNGNSFFGYQTGYANTTGRLNSFFGRMAGYSNTEGNYNSFFGNWSGRNNITGSSNVFLGFKAGYNETGSNKLYISNTDTDYPLIYGEFDNQNITINGTLYATLVSLSDARFKKNILPLESSLEKIDALEGVSYEWKTEEYSGKGFQKGRQIGLIAQDVEKVLPELVYTDSKGYKAIAYDKVVPVLIEAVKELQKTVDEQQKMIGQLKTALHFNQDKDTNLARAN